MSAAQTARAGASGSAVSDERLRELVYRSCLLLDEERFDEYLALFAVRARYLITSWSPDIRRELVLLDHDRDSYATMLSGVRHHERMTGTFSRHLTGQLVERGEEGPARAVSSVLVVHTGLDGASRLFVAGKYLDEFDLSGPHPLIARREARLDTRELGPGSHIPI